jgi:hypothetical protein
LRSLVIERFDNSSISPVLGSADIRPNFNTIQNEVF